ncbi:hypothetical protein K435DRAFT_853898 [Dendrothele bispora CBS 962.96]|uniref:Uncharacterized protein n=1 Tax=Dendrothele bispora (strain CBS 962.96) TaxID=1314807 RepID=A0A4S8MFE9_DENBC|nr:hypothetical protein K435DRAFT_853898 [Dendrothele bispora CBS 962.96]
MARFMEDEGSSQDLSEESPTYYVVRYIGGVDFYSSSQVAFKVYDELWKEGLQPEMRTTQNRQLAQEFACRV